MVKTGMFRAAVAVSLIASSVLGASAVTAQTTESTEVEEEGGVGTGAVVGVLFALGVGLSLVFLTGGDEEPVSP